MIRKLRYGAFSIFGILCIRTIFLSLYFRPLKESFIIGFVLGVISFISLKKIGWCLNGLIIYIPIVSGLQLIGILKNFPLPSLIFAAIFLTWFTQKVFFNKNVIERQTQIENLIDVFSGLVLLSVTSTLLFYPKDFVLWRFWLFPLADQKDPLFCIESATIFLQGLFFYRILLIELEDTLLKNTIAILCVQSVSIVIFSLIQLIWHLPEFNPKNLIRLFSPFEDIHSYGSYMAFLFFVFFVMSYHEKDRIKYFIRSLTGLMSIFIVLSASRVTWMASALTGYGVIFNLQCRKLRYFLSIILLITVCLIGTFSSALKASDNYYFKRLGSSISIENFKQDESLIRRFALWQRALNIIGTFPITGSGIGSFFRISPNFESPNYKRYENFNENAHNYYLQLGAEIGLPGLFIFLSIILYTFKAGFQVLSIKDEFNPLIKGLLFGFSAYLLTMLTGHALLLANQQFFFWFIIATITIPHKTFQKVKIYEKYRHYSKLLIGLLALAIVSSYSYQLYAKQSPLDFQYGFYGVEDWGDDEMRWTWRRAVQKVKASSNLIGLKVVAPSQTSDGPGGLRVRLTLNDKILDELHFFNGGVKPVYYFSNGIKNGDVEIQIEVNKTFNPLRKGLSGDPRELGVAVSPISFLNIMPKDGIGFYEWENWVGGHEKAAIKKGPQKFRWTAKQASINLRQKLREGGTIFLRCAHPDIAQKAVQVEIFSESDLLRTITFSNHEWKAVNITTHELEGQEVLTFRVNRTWNPKLKGISADGRDLGVAVAVSDALAGG